MLRTRILEGIDALRLRKCRPDREAIAHYVLRKYGTQFNEIFNELEVIVDEELLIKVEYKGSISYRLPSSFDTKSSPLLTKHSKILNSVRTTRFILASVNELLSTTESYNVNGIPLIELKEHLEKLEPERFKDNKSIIAIEREVLSKNGNLLKSPRGRIYPKDIPIPIEEAEFVHDGLDNNDGDADVDNANGEKESDGGKPIVIIPEKKKRGRKPKNQQQFVVVVVNPKPDDDTNQTNPPIFAVKSKPIVDSNNEHEHDDEINCIEGKTYEGKYFTLVGSIGSEPPTATATGFTQQQKTENINNMITPGPGHIGIEPEIKFEPEEHGTIQIDGGAIDDLTQFLDNSSSSNNGTSTPPPIDTMRKVENNSTTTIPATTTPSIQQIHEIKKRCIKKDELIESIITTRKKTKR